MKKFVRGFHAVLLLYFVSWFAAVFWSPAGDETPSWDSFWEICGYALIGLPIGVAIIAIVVGFIYSVHWAWKD